jgi:hypothetical protein
MNARLSSLLVAGGVVLAGIQAGSLSAAPIETDTGPVPVHFATLQSAALESDGQGPKCPFASPGS